MADFKKTLKEIGEMFGFESKEHHHEHDHCEHDHCEHEHSHGECGCGGDCEHNEESSLSKKLMLVSLGLVILSFIPFPVWLKITLEVIAVILAGYPIVISSIGNIKEHKVTEIELMLIAAIAACILGEFREAAMVLLLYRFGEMLEDKAIDASRESIDAVTKIQQDFAHLMGEDGKTVTVDAESVKVGTKIVVLPHERFPIDGLVYSGSTMVDASAITGESMPVEISKGSEVKSGMMNGDGSVVVVTTAEFKDSTASRIVQMVEDASEKKGQTQKFITRVAKFYTPIVVGLSVVIAVLGSVITKDVSTWVYRALIFLVASCPCALVISVPLGFYTGIGTAAKRGIITKGSVFIEAVSKAKVVAFDKTGTLTTGEFEISEVKSTGKFSEDQVLLMAAVAEHFSSHPIGKSIVNAAPEIDETQLSDFNEVAGNGASVIFNEKRVFCGSKKYMIENGISVTGVPDGEICVAFDGRIIGTITLRSALRPNVVKMISKLKSQGIEKTVMLTGDNDVAAQEIADICGIDEYYANLLPDEKLNMLRDLKSQNGKVVYVGDGINDAPVLAAADAGVAMGLGTQAANEAADIIITYDRIEKLASTHHIFKRTMNIVKFNIIFALAIKLIVLILGLVGIAPMWLAVFADVGVCVICVLISALIKSKNNILFDKIKL